MLFKSSILCIVLTLLSLTARAQSIPPDRLDWWRAHAPTCDAPDGFRFPSKKYGAICDDGDINLFAGLLCTAGEPLGCETVKRSQGNTGRWFRSPRRAQTDNLGEKNSFSPDMAHGTELYSAVTRDRARLGLWLKWMDDVRPCIIGGGDNCVRSPLLRFCTDDTEKGCTVRPGDAAILDATVKGLSVPLPTEDMRRLLDQAGTNLMDQVWLSSQVNAPGYSQHLVGVEILLLRKLGHTDPKLTGAASALADKQPRNPFFQFLKEGATSRVRDLTLSLCPSPATGLPPEMSQWAWEREDAEQAWKKSLLWDCIFMARLLEGGAK